MQNMGANGKCCTTLPKNSMRKPSFHPRSRRTKFKCSSFMRFLSLKSLMISSLCHGGSFRILCIDIQMRLLPWRGPFSKCVHGGCMSWCMNGLRLNLWKLGQRLFHKWVKFIHLLIWIMSILIKLRLELMLDLNMYSFSQICLHISAFSILKLGLTVALEIGFPCPFPVSSSANVSCHPWSDTTSS